MEEILMTPQVCMQFLVWSYYYHGILPDPMVSYAATGRFSEADVVRLDELKAMLFKCFEVESVHNACHQFEQARLRQEPCPFSQEQLDRVFAKEQYN